MMIGPIDEFFRQSVYFDAQPSLCVLGIACWALDIASGHSQEDGRKTREWTLPLDGVEDLDVIKNNRVRDCGFRLLGVEGSGSHLGHFLGKWRSS